MSPLETVDSKLKGELDGASPHTIWVRKDLWEAVRLKKIRDRRSLRSIVEEALYKFLEHENGKFNVKEYNDGI
jgi:hypothetical protein